MNIQIKKHDVRDLFKTDRNVSRATLETYHYCIREYYKFIQTTGQVDGIKAVELWLETTGSASTYNLRKAAIAAHLRRRFENESAEKRFEIEQWFKKLKAKKPDQRQTESKYLPHADVMTLAEGSTDIISCLVLGLYWTGCRVSELINIRLDDCRAGKFVTIKVMGKGSRERDVYMPRPLFDRIRKVFNGKTCLFETRNGGKYNRLCVTREIKRQSQRVLGVSISAHSLRHSKAMFLKDGRGMSADRVAKALGHTNVTTTLKFYFHGTPGPEEQGIFIT